jgi:hypothetical protein
VSRFGKGFNKPVAGKGAAAGEDYFHFFGGKFYFGFICGDCRAG